MRRESRMNESEAELHQIMSESDEPTSSDDQSDELLWIALLISGDPVKAQRSVVGMNGSSGSGNKAVNDWLATTAARTSARVATEESLSGILKSVRACSVPSFSMNSLDPLTDEQIKELCCVPVEKVIRELDALTRCVLVLRGLTRCSIDECAGLARVTRDCVIAAYDRALGWLTYQQRTHEFGNDPLWGSELRPTPQECETILAS